MTDYDEDQERIAELERDRDEIQGKYDNVFDQLSALEASLARRDLLVAADALEQAADALELAIDSGSCRAILFDYADRLRLEAEGNDALKYRV